MTDPVTPVIGLSIPARNADINTWDVPVNGNFQIIDGCIGGTLVIYLTNAAVVLTLAQCNAIQLVFLGKLTANVTVSLPQGRAGLFSVLNGTTGPFKLLINTTANDFAVNLPQGLRTLILSDGLNVALADQSSVPPGTPLPWLSSNIPAGFVLACGQVLSIAAYPGIANALGGQFNTGGEGAGNFRMPDMRGMVLAGLDNMGGSARGLLTSFGSSGQTLGAQGGEQSHILAVAEMPTHSHPVNDLGHNHPIQDPQHQHNYLKTNSGNAGATTGAGANQGTTTAQTDPATTGITVSNATTGITLQNAGGGGAHNNVQPTMLVNWIIKT